MKKWYLQLFADDPAVEGDPVETEDRADQEKKTRDEKKEEKKEPKYTDEDVDRIINRKFAEWEKKQQAKVDEAAKLADMTATEKEKYRADKAEKELADLKREIALGKMAGTARKMLSEENITVPDEIIMNLVCDDAEKTKSAVESFAKVFKDAVQAAVKESLKGNPPKASTGDTTTVTRKQIIAVKDRTERQRLIAENPQLFVRK